MENPIARSLRVAESLVLVMTGDGKGKSTAAYGTMLRAIDRSQKVSVVQFAVPNDWTTGEENVAQSLGVAWFAVRDARDGEASAELVESARCAQIAWETAKQHLATGDYELIILDELTQPMNWGWLDEHEVLAAIANRSPTTSVLITGRAAPASLVEIADTVTTMENTKHAYQSGLAAKAGIDY
jgi:cob(I)alamin adenosyltransferase